MDHGHWTHHRANLFDGKLTATDCNGGKLPAPIFICRYWIKRQIRASSTSIYCQLMHRHPTQVPKRIIALKWKPICHRPQCPQQLNRQPSHRRNQVKRVNQVAENVVAVDMCGKWWVSVRAANRAEADRFRQLFAVFAMARQTSSSITSGAPITISPCWTRIFCDATRNRVRPIGKSMNGVLAIVGCPTSTNIRREILSACRSWPVALSFKSSKPPAWTSSHRNDKIAHARRLPTLWTITRITTSVIITITITRRDRSVPRSRWLGIQQSASAFTWRKIKKPASGYRLNGATSAQRNAATVCNIDRYFAIDRIQTPNDVTCATHRIRRANARHRVVVKSAIGSPARGANAVAIVSV